MLEALITSGRITDVILVLLVVEVVVISLVYQIRGQGIAPLNIITATGAGACLVLALRESLTDDRWQYIALYLLMSLVFHLADLIRRWLR